MFAKAEVVPLFPTCVWRHEVADAAALNSALMAEIDVLKQTEPSRSKSSGSWQSVGDLHRREAFADFTKVIVAAVRGVFDYLRIQSDGIVITNCWANVNYRGHSHHMHTHPNNLLSGVYYAKIPPGSGKIVFSDPRPQARVLIPTYREYTPQNSAKHTFEVAEGVMLLFPSWLEHHVEEHGAEEERVSIAFNAVPKGRLGYDSGLLEI